MNTATNVTAAPVKKEDVKAGERYYIVERVYENDPENYTLLEGHGVVREIDNTGGILRFRIRWEDNDEFVIVAQNYTFYAAPMNWKSVYDTAAKNAAVSGTIKALPLPANARSVIQSYVKKGGRRTRRHRRAKKVSRRHRRRT